MSACLFHVFFLVLSWYAQLSICSARWLSIHEPGTAQQNRQKPVFNRWNSVLSWFEHVFNNSSKHICRSNQPLLSGNLTWVFPLTMLIFHSHVNLPNGNFDLASQSVPSLVNCTRTFLPENSCLWQLMCYVLQWIVDQPTRRWYIDTNWCPLLDS